MSAYYNYECPTCGQTTTDTEVNKGDVLNVKSDCWSCGAKMDGYISWDNADNHDPQATYINEDQIKIDKV